MEKKICSYETLFVVDVTRSEEEQKALIEKFTSLIADNGTVEAVNEWGKRRLAYPINDLLEGFFVNVTFKSEPAFPAELKRIFGITDGILRSNVIRLGEKKAPVAEEAAE
ncbi:MAG: 30S ribosomal protein S6 [Clostridia bacterium]|nr:30S ribosomal protein S6 [Clostridia bacterium]